jgi:hypothetical protein
MEGQLEPSIITYLECSGSTGHPFLGSSLANSVNKVVSFVAKTHSSINDKIHYIMPNSFIINEVKSFLITNIVF